MKNKLYKKLSFIGLSLLLLAIPKLVFAFGKDDIYNALGWLFYIVTEGVNNILVYLLSWVTAIASYSNFTGVLAVQQGWTIVRDLCNMFFILVLLVIAFCTILRIPSYEMKKALPKLIIMAVLINFSKTICGLIIDFAQVIMLTFIGAISGGGINNSVNLLGMDKMWQFAQDKTKNNEDLNSTVVLSLMTGFIASLIALVVIIVMIALLLMRIVFLWIYIILSPIVFFGAAVPSVQKYTGSWWGEFTSYVFSGPILAFFLWLALSTAQQSATLLNTTDVITDQETKFLEPQVFATYLITIGLLIGGLMITQKTSAALGSIAGKGIAAINKGKGMVGKGLKRGALGTTKWGAKKIGTGALGVGGMALTKMGKEGTMLNAMGKTAVGWRTDMLSKDKKAKDERRRKTLEKIGFGESAAGAYKDLQKTKGAENIKAGVQTIGHMGKAVGLGTLAMATGGSTLPALATTIGLSLGGIAQTFKAKNLPGKVSDRRKLEELDKQKVADEKKAKDTHEVNLAKINKEEEEEIRKYTSPVSLDAVSADKREAKKKEIQETYLKQKQTKATVYKQQTDQIAADHKTEVEKITKSEEKPFWAARWHTNKELQEAGFIDNLQPSPEGGNWHPNQVSIRAAALITKTKDDAKKRAEEIASGSDVTQWDQNRFYAPGGLNNENKELIKSLAKNSKSLDQMHLDLKKAALNKGKLKDRQLNAILGMKQMLAAGEKAGIDTSAFTQIRDILNNEFTHFHSDEKYNPSVEELKSKVTS